ncbi:RES family NAD+ phosphorylase [Parapedobacter sp. 10938]|uniref:RES family NAD+ phosphorylase n=1 Tax=Parapedobacter flavus TaxID=3110225 RepID=UPI002DB85217|nr:RES family NAD+ phosphorylase [Parapedobacter sp. 10938]MEC3878129.1 RES family NAD+ phosphorylase [Parapedobacter sp. 10938]
MLIYRIAHKQYSRALFAPGFGGRWNSEGKKVIYAAESIPLAFLESMLRRQGVGFNRDFNTMIIEVPDTLPVKTIDVEQLPDAWRDSYDYRICQQIGDEWYDSGETPLLKVPSAVLPDAANYVIHTAHPDYSRIKLVNVTTLIPDQRIEGLLRK